MGSAQLRLHFIVIILGFTGILGALIDLPSGPLVWWRMGIAFLSIAAAMAISGRARPVSGKTALQLIGTGLIVAAHWVTFFESIKLSTVSVALACFASTTLFVAFIEPFFFRRKIFLSEVVLGLAVIAGLWMIFNFEERYTQGIIYGVSCALLCALFGVLNGKFIRYHSAVSIALLEMLGGFAGVSIYLIFTGSVPLQPLPAQDWLWLILLGTVCTAYTFVGAIGVMKELSPYTVAMTINLEPIYAILLALVIFGEEEKMTPGFYLGTVVILLTVFINARFKKKRREAAVNS